MYMFERRKRRRLEARRQRAVAEIRGERATFETMVKRALVNGVVADESLKGVPLRFEEFERKAREARSIEEVEDVIKDAEEQGQLRAYICPPAEVADEGMLAINLMEEWGIPKGTLAKLRQSLGERLQSGDISISRGALRAVFEEFDSWSEYVDDYEETMESRAHLLLWLVVGLLLGGLIAIHFPKTVLVGLFLAGAAGACGSVALRMPVLDVTPSGTYSAYGRRIFTRIIVGIVASVIGCALLGWGLLPISIQNLSFSDVLNACTAFPGSSCTELKALILLGVAMAFGFSERALISLEGSFRFIGNGSAQRASRRNGPSA
jgi:hypothetical protein